MPGYEQPFDDDRELPLELWNPDALFDIPKEVEDEDTGRVSGSLLHRAMNNTELLTPDEQSAYAQLGIISPPTNEADKRVESDFVVSNLRLAAWLVRQTMNWPEAPGDNSVPADQRIYKGRYIGNLANYAGHPLEYDDRLQAATIGLLDAARKYSGQGRYSTLAVHTIEGSIGRAFDNQPEPSGVRFPSNVHQSLRNIHKAENLLGQAASDDAIADMAKVSLSDLMLYRELTEIHRRPTLDAAASEVADTVAQNEAETVFELYQRRAASAAVKAALEGLSQREAGVIRLRFGFVDGILKSLDEVAEIYGVTRERIRQIEAKSLKKLRHPSRSQELAQYLDINDEGADYEETVSVVKAKWTGRQHKSGIGNQYRGMKKTGTTLMAECILGNITPILKQEVSAWQISEYLKQSKGIELGESGLEILWQNHAPKLIEAFMAAGDVGAAHFNQLYTSLFNMIAKPDSIINLSIPDQLSGKLNYVGTRLKQGKMFVQGSVGTNAGFGMTGGLLYINGEAGDLVGNAAWPPAHIHVTRYSPGNYNHSLQRMGNLTFGDFSQK